MSHPVGQHEGTPSRGQPSIHVDGKRDVDAERDIDVGIEEALKTLALLAGTSSRLPAGTTGVVFPTPASAGAGSQPSPAGQATPTETVTIDALAAARYRTLVEQIPAVTFLASLEGDANELYVSPQIQSLLGFTQEEWVSDPVLWYRQTHPDDRARVSAKFAATCLTGEPFLDTIRMVARNGESVWVHAEGRLVRRPDGQPLFLQGVGFDVTQQLRATEAREALIREQAARAAADQARERRDDFLAAATHDLKTPLTAILGLVELLQRGTARSGGIPPEALAEMLTHLSKSATKMAQLLDQLLDVARLQMDAPLHLTKQRTELSALVREVVQECRRISDRHELVVQSVQTEVWGVVDAARLERVVSNLLTNAIKYSPQGGRVTLRLSCYPAEQGAWATLAVQDEGLGIPEEDVPHVFEKFHRAANVIGRLPGTGIGLAYASQVIQEHGGRIELASRVGVGTTFTVHLPLEEPVCA